MIFINGKAWLFIASSNRYLAGEFRLFCLYLSLPLVGRYLPKKYVAHWRLLVEVLLILSSRSIPLHDIPLVHYNLMLFVVLYGILYAPRFCSLEIHMLKHTVRGGMYSLLLCPIFHYYQ